jgi:hypothetical protein
MEDPEKPLAETLAARGRRPRTQDTYVWMLRPFAGQLAVFLVLGAWTPNIQRLRVRSARRPQSPSRGAMCDSLQGGLRSLSSCGLRDYGLPRR